MKKLYCYNCGKSGHVYTVCTFPTMSYGMIVYQIRNKIPYYLMVQRNGTPEFREIIKGKLDFNNYAYIKRLVQHLTLLEIKRIQTQSHEALYNDMDKYYKIKKNKQYYDKMEMVQQNYMKLINGFVNNDGILVKFDNILDELMAEKVETFLEPDWGFPKGRRNYKMNVESDLECAIRELNEEAGLHPNEYELWNNYWVIESYNGSNDVKYSHKYYIAKSKNNVSTIIDPCNKYQIGEVRKIGWYTYENAVKMMRPFHEEKKKILARIHSEICKKYKPTIGFAWATGNAVAIVMENNAVVEETVSENDVMPKDENSNMAELSE